MCSHVLVCVCLCSERPHACTKGRGSVGWCDGDVQVVANLETLRLQRHGIIGALPAGYGAADVLQPEVGDKVLSCKFITNQLTLL